MLKKLLARHIKLQLSSELAAAGLGKNLGALHLHWCVVEADLALGWLISLLSSFALLLLVHTVRMTGQLSERALHICLGNRLLVHRRVSLGVVKSDLVGQRLRRLLRRRVVVVLFRRLEEERELVEWGNRPLIGRHEVAWRLALHDRHVGRRRDDV